MQQLRRLKHCCQRFSRKIAQDPNKMIFNHNHPFARKRRHHTRANRNRFLEMTQHRVLRREDFLFLPRIGYLEHKLLTASGCEQKIPIALTRQLACARLNTEIFLGYSLCAFAIHGFHGSRLEVLHASANPNAAAGGDSSRGANPGSRILQAIAGKLLTEPVGYGKP